MYERKRNTQIKCLNSSTAKVVPLSLQGRLKLPQGEGELRKTIHMFLRFSYLTIHPFTQLDPSPALQAPSPARGEGNISTHPTQIILHLFCLSSFPFSTIQLFTQIDPSPWLSAIRHTVSQGSSFACSN